MVRPWTGQGERPRAASSCDAEAWLEAGLEAKLEAKLEGLRNERDEDELQQAQRPGMLAKLGTRQGRAGR